MLLKNSSKEFVTAIREKMLTLCNILGIKPYDEVKSDKISADEVEALIAEKN